MRETIFYVIMTVLLLTAALQDIYAQRLSLWFLIFFCAFGIVGGLLAEVDTVSGIIGLLPGGILLVLAFITREQIGIADGAICTTLGFFLGFVMIIEVLGITLILSALCSAVLMIILRKKKGYRIPFLPFLFMGLCVTLAFHVQV